MSISGEELIDEELFGGNLMNVVEPYMYEPTAVCDQQEEVPLADSEFDGDDDTDYEGVPGFKSRRLRLFIPSDTEHHSRWFRIKQSAVKWSEHNLLLLLCFQHCPLVSCTRKIHSLLIFSSFGNK
jgi:hypothetical protein